MIKYTLILLFITSCSNYKSNLKDDFKRMEKIKQLKDNNNKLKDSLILKIYTV